MSNFKYISRDSKDYSKSFNNGNVDTRQVTINEYNPNKQYNISIYKFIDILNSIETSKNALDICNSICCNIINIRQKALDFGLTYKNIFNGDNNSYNARKVLEIINCSVNPTINIKTYKSLCYVKWKIYEINEKNIKLINNDEDDKNNISEWIGVLAGLILYFDELDETNFNTTKYSKDICKPLTVKDI